MVDPEERSTLLSTNVQRQVWKFLEWRVAAKFGEGNVAGAVRKISSPESIALNCRETLELLKRKHPLAPADRHLLDPPDASLVGHVLADCPGRFDQCGLEGRGT